MYFAVLFLGGFLITDSELQESFILLTGLGFRVYFGVPDRGLSPTYFLVFLFEFRLWDPRSLFSLPGVGQGSGGFGALIEHRAIAFGDLGLECA